MKVMITYPPLVSDGRVPLLSQNRQFQWFSNPTYLYPLVPASAATLLREKGYEVQWKDAIAEGLSESEYNEYFRQASPDLVAIETKTPVVRQHWRIIRELKTLVPSAVFVLMGDHVTAFPDESLEACPELDYVLTGGDYDFSLLALADAISGNRELPAGLHYRRECAIVTTGPFTLEDDLDTLPIVDRELTLFKYYDESNIKYKPFAYTMVGRDCPYHLCRFCSWTTIFPKFRVRSPENYIDEVGMLINKYGVREIFDDTGTFPSGGWLERFCELMVERGYHKKVTISCNFRFDYVLKPGHAEMMKKAGFRLIKSGLESANQATLDRLRKGIKVEDIINGCRAATKAGLEVHLTMMVGFPWETKQETLNTLDLARYLMSHGLAEVLQSTVVIPYPGTPLYHESIDNSWFRIDPAEYERYDMTEPVLQNRDLMPEEIMEICSRIYRIYLTPGYLLHRLGKIRSWDDIHYHLDGIKAVLKHVGDFATRRKAV